MLHSLTKLGDDNSWVMLARRAKPGDDTFSLRCTYTGSCPLPIESWGILARRAKPGDNTFSLRHTRTGSSPSPVEFASRDLLTNNFRDDISVLISDLAEIKFIARLYADDAMATDL